MNSGRTFHSTMDPHIGQPLLRGYDYMGRLQYLADNPTLCPGTGNDANQAFDIVAPVDGLPVALVAQAGGCSIQEKARVAAELIHPANNVQYLIIQNPSKRHESTPPLNDYGINFQNHGTNHHDQSEMEPLGSRYGSLELESLLESFTGDCDDESFFLDLDGSDAEQHGRVLTHLTDRTEQSNTNDWTEQWSWRYSDDINLAVVHVTSGVGEELFRAVAEESRIDRRQGGTRILLNGQESNVSARTVIIWMLLSFTICACTCCCVLVFVQTGFEEEEDPQAPRRPVRRRLTLEQVRTRFPSFHFNPQEHHQNNNNCCGDDDADGETAAQQKGGYMQLSDECTICLDEFTPGVRVRELPCGHVFHSTCIARWLIERSAVCPLCKLDLYEEPVEDDDEDDDEDEIGGEASPEQTPLSFFRSWWSGSTTSREGYTQLEVPLGDAPEADAVAEEPIAPVGPSGAIEEGATAGGEEEARSWWPFSLETAPSTDEQEENPRRRPTSSALLSAAGVVSWTMTLFGNRRRHEPHPQPNQEHTNDGSLLTELTEPLVSQQQDSLDEVRFNTDSRQVVGPVDQTDARLPDDDTANRSSSPTTSAEV